MPFSNYIQSNLFVNSEFVADQFFIRDMERPLLDARHATPGPSGTRERAVPTNPGLASFPHEGGASTCISRVNRGF
ncbi:hypothetical protein GQ600_16172 [Phytophthora cactorum]|nr:hypothetical protein GQ600_16172 [Phytophthora cactorum]